MQRYSCLGVLAVATLLAWELGQVVATYVTIGLFGEQYSLAFAPAGGWGQTDVLAVLTIRLVLAAVVAAPLVITAARLLFRDRSRE